MDITLNITFCNQDNCIEQIFITANKDSLINKSDYFKSILTKGFNEVGNTELNIDLTTLHCLLSSKYIKIFFDIGLNGYHKTLKDEQRIIIAMDTLLETSKFNYNIEIDLGMTKYIQIHELHYMIALCDYFAFNEVRQIIIGCLNNYLQYVNNYLQYVIDLNSEIEAHQIEYIANEKIEFYSNNIISIDKDTIKRELEYYKQVYIINDFLKNIYYIYLSYKQMNQEMYDIFKDLITMVSRTIIKQREQKSPPIIETINKSTFNEIQLSVDDLKQIPLNDCNELINGTNGLVTTETQVFKLYDFYDILNYEKPTTNIFKIKRSEDVQYKANIKCVTAKDKVIKLFRTMTDNMFEKMNWTNVILTGGFIYGLVNNLSDSLIGSTDIDLFTYNDENGKTKTYLLDYFSQYKPYYSTKGNVTTIIIPSFPYDIQIIPTNKSSPYEVIRAFDFSYVKTYYDGNDIYTTLDGLMSFKYATTTCTPQNDEHTVSDIRLYKTILKGLDIVYNSDINNTFIKKSEDNIVHIDYDSMGQNEEIKTALNKPQMIRKLSKYVTDDEMVSIIKAYYQSHVTMDRSQIKNTKLEQDMLDGYNFINNLVDVADIIKLVDAGRKGNVKYSSLELTNNKVINTYSLKTGFCTIVNVFDDEVYDKDNISLLLALDDDSIVKMMSLTVKLAQLYKSYVNRRTVVPHILHNQENTQLKIIIPKNTELYKKYGNQISKLKNGNQIKVNCSGQFWHNGNGSGMKFRLSSFELKPTKNLED